MSSAVIGGDLCIESCPVVYGSTTFLLLTAKIPRLTPIKMIVDVLILKRKFLHLPISYIPPHRDKLEPGCSSNADAMYVGMLCRGWGSRLGRRDVVLHVIATPRILCQHSCPGQRVDQQRLGMDDAARNAGDARCGLLDVLHPNFLLSPTIKFPIPRSLVPSQPNDLTASLGSTYCKGHPLTKPLLHDI